MNPSGEMPDPRSILDVLRAHEGELRDLGVERLALFGSVARGEQTPDSDIDIVVRLVLAEPGGYAYFDRVLSLRRRLSQLLDREVDIVTEPVRKPHLRRSIEAEQLRAF